MVSLYAKYLTERTDDRILEIKEGFATYRYLNENQVYIIDIFVLPQFRKKGIASQIADRICDEAKHSGCTEMIGTVNLLTKGATASLLVLIAYGMKLKSCSDNMIILTKEI